MRQRPISTPLVRGGNVLTLVTALTLATRILTFGISSIALVSCAERRVANRAPETALDDATKGHPASGVRVARRDAEIELVESVPIETTLDHADVRDTVDVWPELIDRATHTLDFSQFYASDMDGDEAKTSRLAPVVAAIERASSRNVRVRFLADASFAEKYPATLERLRKSNADVRTIDAKERYGGVQHSKYFVVDGVESFVGSQNFDWRALTHIQEIGVRIRSVDIARELLDVFEVDWALATTAHRQGAPSPTEQSKSAVVGSGEKSPSRDANAAIEVPARRRAGATSSDPVKTTGGERVSLYASPKGWLPDASRWDLPKLVAMIDGARASVNLQVMKFSTVDRDGGPFTTLASALRRAAARGARVRLLVSHWGARLDTTARHSVDELSALPNVDVRVMTIPPWSGGDVPFARVAHAKYMLVDDGVAWIGTSNWEGDYFYKSRNVSVVVEGGELVTRLGRVFENGWSSPHTAPLAPPRH